MLTPVAVPHTRTRLKGYVSIQAHRGGKMIQSAADLESLDFVTIGGAAQLTINEERQTNDLRREFGAPFTGILAETYPGLPRFSVILHRVDLYDSNLMEAFKIAPTSINIVQQYKPLVLNIIQPVPEDDNGNPILYVNEEKATVAAKRRTLIIPGCWFNEFRIEWNLQEADQKFIQEAEMICSDIYNKS